MKLRKILFIMFLTGNALLMMQYPTGFAAQGETAAKVPAEAAKESSPANLLPVNATRAAREEKALQDARRQQLAEKEQ